jgi:hypothetical protein
MPQTGGTIMREFRSGLGTQTRWWALVGAAGAVSIVGCLLPIKIVDRYLDEPNGAQNLAEWHVRTDAGWLMPADLGRHFRLQPPGGDLQHITDCDVLDGADCYYAGSPLGAVTPLKEWERAGYDDALLCEFLAGYYREVFGEDA